MSDVVLVTPPDRLYTNEYSILLIHPSLVVKEQFQNLLLEADKPVHVYLYELHDEHHQPEWLIDVFQQVDIAIIDIDNCSHEIRDIASYFLSRNKTFWLTNSTESFYNKVSNNQIYTLDFLISKIGGNLEKK
jgi:hypothetical protein